MDIIVLKQIIHNFKATLGVLRMSIRYALLGEPEVFEKLKELQNEIV